MGTRRCMPPCGIGVGPHEFSEERIDHEAFKIVTPPIHWTRCPCTRIAGVRWHQPRMASAADDAAKDGAATSQSTRTLTDRGIAFLRPRQDAKGGWSTQREPGVTALVVTALLRSGQVAPGEPRVTKALAYLESFIGPKGGYPRLRTRITRLRSHW